MHPVVIGGVCKGSGRSSPVEPARKEEGAALQHINILRVSAIIIFITRIGEIVRGGPFRDISSHIIYTVRTLVLWMAANRCSPCRFILFYMGIQRDKPVPPWPATPICPSGSLLP